MAYTIIGIDGKQYGPVGEEDLRRWIAEGRLNGQSQAQGEGDTEFHPLSAFPEFADALARQAPLALAPPSSAPAGPPSPAELAAGDYDLAIDGCIGAGWRVVKNNFWPSVGANFMVVAASILLSLLTRLITQPTIDEMVEQHHFTPGGVLLLGLTNLLAAPFNVVLFSGLYIYFLKLSRGQNPTPGDAFAGFGSSFGQLYLLGLAQTILVLAGLLLCVVPGIYLVIAWTFAPCLVIDRGMGFWEAMELSRKMVSKHWFLVFGFVIVYALLAASGILGCCVGLLVTLPIGLAALICGYETIFSRRQNQSAGSIGLPNPTP